MSSKLGMHWIKYHQERRDLAHIEAMQYKSVKLFEWHWNNRDACADLLSVLPKDSYILARDHPMSEQKQDMWSDPAGTGIRHANEWAMKVTSGNVHTPVERTFFLGINEPDATNGDRNAIDTYTTSFLNRLKTHGLRGGAFNFSTGHPRTVDGTGNTLADYSVFERSHEAIVNGHHIGILHIYGTAAVPNAPGHYDRLKACTWQDVEWVVGECGADEHVVGGGNHDGYLISMRDNPSRYCDWLDQFILGVNDSRIHSYQVFTYDFSHPWGSFNVSEIRGALEGYTWRHVTQKPTSPIDTRLPAIGTGPKPAQPPKDTPKGRILIAPCQGTITQRWGENPENYKRFNIPGHNGWDIANSAGTPIVAVADGVVSFVGEDVDYGNYVRVTHSQLGFDSFYAHLLGHRVSVGEVVKQGQEIAAMGSTGNSTGNHLHLEFRLTNGNSYIDLSGGYGKGRFDPAIAYWLLNRVAYGG